MVGQTVTWTNLAFKPNQKRCVPPFALSLSRATYSKTHVYVHHSPRSKLTVVVGVAGLTGTLSFPAEVYKISGGNPYRGAFLLCFYECRRLDVCMCDD